jgi:phosphate transport system protein
VVFLQRQIDKLKKQLVSLGTLVEENVRDAITAVTKRDPELARQVIQKDNRIDLAEVDLEEECLHTLALHQPVAFDLRYVVAVLKINNDLERIGDHAKNIAEQAIALSEEAEVDHLPYELPKMSRCVEQMLRRSLDALISLDVEAAREVREMDDEVDTINRGMYDAVIRQMREDPHQIEQLIHFMSISKQLERMADHTTNIAKDVLYMAQGEITRHERLRKAAKKA